MRNRVEVAAEVRIHHLGVARLEQLLHASEGIFATAPRPEAVALVRKVPFEDRLQHQAKRRLDDAIPHGRNPERAPLAAPRFRYPDAPYRLRPIRALTQLPREMCERVVETRFDHRNGL